jgi:hypothetical protein
MSKQNIVENVSNILDIVEERINTAVAGGKTIAANGLAAELAPRFGLTPVQVVAIIGMYVASRADELVSKPGKFGGIGARK